jgi:hypothetical protein
MSVIYQMLGADSEDRAGLHSIILARHLDGECYAFAIALSRGLGWPITGIMHKGEIRHAVVCSPAGVFFDARGMVSEKELGEPFGLEAPYELVPIKQTDLFDLRFGGVLSEIAEQELRIIQDYAELVWPDLPWLSPRSARFLAFVDELEQLSRKHAIWVFAPTPGQRPPLTIGEGDEKGYVLSPTLNNTIWTVDRCL